MIANSPFETKLNEAHFKIIGEVADAMQLPCYVIGGFVRDLFLYRSDEDIDIVMKSNNNSFFEVLKFTKKINAKLIYSASSTRFSKGNIDEFMSPYSFTKLKNVEFLLQD